MLYSPELLWNEPFYINFAGFFGCPIYYYSKGTLENFYTFQIPQKSYLNSWFFMSDNIYIALEHSSLLWNVNSN